MLVYPHLPKGFKRCALWSRCLSDDEWDRRFSLTTPMSADRQTSQIRQPNDRRLEMKGTV